MFSLEIVRHLLHFKQPAGTSRGVYKTRRVWYLILKDKASGAVGVGECAPLYDLSCDAMDDDAYEHQLCALCRDFVKSEKCNYEAFRNYPSMLFGLETALVALKQGSLDFAQQYLATYDYSALFASTEAQRKAKAFTQSWLTGEQGITINGLIWMGDFETMYQRIQEKLAVGFHCIKLKIGAINFEKEIELLSFIRQHFTKDQIELRVDANGAFTKEDAMEKLTRLASFQLHSIEQPIKAGQYEALAALTKKTPLPIALDEELIGLNTTEEKVQLLDTVQPQYIVLKPSLHGGIKGTLEWITLAKERNIGYWITSALESNVGLNALAQFVATLDPELPQGLGTGQLFTDQIEYPLHIKGEALYFSAQEKSEDLKAYLQRCGSTVIATLE